MRRMVPSPQGDSLDSVVGYKTELCTTDHLDYMSSIPYQLLSLFIISVLASESTLSDVFVFCLTLPKESTLIISKKSLAAKEI